MRRLGFGDWIMSLTVTLGMASATFAQDTSPVLQADVLFNSNQEMLIQPVNAQCAPLECAPLGCDSLGCDSSYVPCDGLGCDSIGGGCGGGVFSDEGFDLSDAIFGEESAIDIGGWVQFGYTNKTTGLFNTDPHRFNNHQSWLYMEKVADGSEGIDFGFRMDFMYGTDAGDTQAFGNNNGVWDYDANDPDFWANHGIYGFAIPQLYAEVAMGDLSVRAGHFYTLLGYEVVTAPDNFFYSHAFTMYNSEAFTHTGVLGTYAASDDVTLYGGWTLGWDTGFDQVNGGSSFLGGASVSVTDDLSVTYILTAGNLGANGVGYTHSIVADLAVTDKLNYVAQSDLVRVETADTIGVNQYLLYSLNDKIGVGGRAEWWKANGSSVYSITGGVNIKPTANLTLRPEVRYQWSPDFNNIPAAVQAFSFDDGAIFGIDAIFTF